MRWVALFLSTISRPRDRLEEQTDRRNQFRCAARTGRVTQFEVRMGPAQLAVCPSDRKDSRVFGGFLRGVAAGAVRPVDSIHGDAAHIARRRDWIGVVSALRRRVDVPQ